MDPESQSVAEERKISMGVRSRNVVQKREAEFLLGNSELNGALRLQVQIVLWGAVEFYIDCRGGIIQQLITCSIVIH